MDPIINNIAIQKSEKEAHYSVYAPVKLNGVATNALIDSGNLVCNAVGLPFAKQILGVDDIKPYIEAVRCRIGTAEKGKSMRIVGIFKKAVDLSFGSGTKPYRTKPLVFASLNSELNICGPFLAKHKIDHLHSRQGLRVQGKLVPLVHRGPRPQELQGVYQVVAQPPGRAAVSSLGAATTPPKEMGAPKSPPFRPNSTMGAPKSPHTNKLPTSNILTQQKRNAVQKLVELLAAKRAPRREAEPNNLKSTGRNPMSGDPTEGDDEKWSANPAVYVREQTTIAPHTMRLVPLRVEGNSPTDTIMLIEPADGNYDNYRGISEQNTIATVVKLSGNNTAHVPVWNLRDIPMPLRAGLPYGRAEIVKIPQETPIAQVNELTHEQKKKPSLTKERREWLLSTLALEKTPWLERDEGHLKQAEQLVLEFHDVFSRDDEYGSTDLVQHAIHTGDAAPIKCKNRPINPLQQENLREQLDKWERQGVIEPSESPWGFALLAVPKKNGKTRWAVDYRRLNDITVKDSYPLPNIEDNLARLGKSRVFSALDGAGAFHVVSIRPQDRAKTAFQSPYGLYQFAKMPFGLCNAPSTYSRLVQIVLRDMSPDVALAYLDDTLLHTGDVSKHLGVLRHYLRNNRKAGLMLQPEKCKLFQNQVEYLGHLVSAEGIRPLDDYVAIVRDWPEPTTISELRTFLGKVQYYRRFIRQFSKIAAPLYDLLSSKAKEEGKTDGKAIKVDAEARKAFQDLRQALVEAPILAHPDFHSEEPFILDTDWSKDPGAIGAVLSQKQDGIEKVICYGARKLTKAEQNYGSNKGELLAVIHFMKNWRYYLRHKPFILRTDHHAMKWIKTMEEPAGMIQRWLDTLSNFNFTVQFRPGEKHGNADALSRITHAPPPNQADEKESTDEAVCVLAYPNAEEVETLMAQQEGDPTLRVVRAWIEQGLNPRPQELRNESPEVRQYASISPTLYLDDDDVLRRRANPGEAVQRSRVCLPQMLQDDVIKRCHEDGGGHMGVSATQQRVATRFYFPGLHKAVEMAVADCLVCQRKRTRDKDQKHTLMSIQEGYPFQKIAIDIVGPLRAPAGRNAYILTVKDCFTRWLEAIPTNDTTARNIVRLLQNEIFSRYGMPEQIHSDNAPNISGREIQEVCQLLNIKKTTTPTYNPKSNTVERAHQDLHRMLRALIESTGQTWEELLPEALFAIRTARNRYTGVTPFFALYGREAAMPIDHIYPHEGGRYPYKFESNLDFIARLRAAHSYMRRKVQTAVERARHNYTGILRGSPLKEDDYVWLYTPVTPRNKHRKHTCFWTGPWRVRRRISPVLFLIETAGDWNRRVIRTTVGIDRLKRYVSLDQPVERQNLDPDDLAVDDEFLEQAAADIDREPHVRRPLPRRVHFRDDDDGGPDDGDETVSWHPADSAPTRLQPDTSPPATAAPATEEKATDTEERAAQPTRRPIIPEPVENPVEDEMEDADARPVRDDTPEFPWESQPPATPRSRRPSTPSMQWDDDPEFGRLQLDEDDPLDDFERRAALEDEATRMQIDYQPPMELEHEERPALERDLRAHIQYDGPPAIDGDPLHGALNFDDLYRMTAADITEEDEPAQPPTDAVEHEDRPAIEHEDTPAVDREERPAVARDERRALEYQPPSRTSGSPRHTSRRQSRSTASSSGSDDVFMPADITPSAPPAEALEEPPAGPSLRPRVSADARARAKAQFEATLRERCREYRKRQRKSVASEPDDKRGRVRSHSATGLRTRSVEDGEITRLIETQASGPAPATGGGKRGLSSSSSSEGPDGPQTPSGRALVMPGRLPPSSTLPRTPTGRRLMVPSRLTTLPEQAERPTARNVRRSARLALRSQSEGARLTPGETSQTRERKTVTLKVPKLRKEQDAHWKRKRQN